MDNTCYSDSRKFVNAIKEKKIIPKKKKNNYTQSDEINSSTSNWITKQQKQQNVANVTNSFPRAFTGKKFIIMTIEKAKKSINFSGIS